jgi:hypothetical protein
VLIYPPRDVHSVDFPVGDIRVRTVAYALDGQLDSNGHEFLGNLGLEST